MVLILTEIAIGQVTVVAEVVEDTQIACPSLVQLHPGFGVVLQCLGGEDLLHPEDLMTSLQVEKVLGATIRMLPQEKATGYAQSRHVGI